MMMQDRVVLSKEVSSRIKAVRSLDTNEFCDLISVSGLDPRSDLMFSDLSGLDLSGADLRGYNFGGCNLLDANLVGALVDDETSFEGAALDDGGKQFLIYAGSSDNSSKKWREAMEEASRLLMDFRASEALDTYVKKALQNVPRQGHQDWWMVTLAEISRTLILLGEKSLDVEVLANASKILRSIIKFEEVNKALDMSTIYASLGVVMNQIGVSQNSISLFAEAEKNFRRALDCSAHPPRGQEWAQLKSNLAYALFKIGERSASEDKLQEAIDEYGDALSSNFPASAGLERAMIKHNLANALARLGERRGDDDLFQAAGELYSAALLNVTRTSSPIDWATIQCSIANCRISMAEKSGDRSLLTEALDNVQVAISLFNKHGFVADKKRAEETLVRASLSVQERRNSPH